MKQYLLAKSNVTVYENTEVKSISKKDSKVIIMTDKEEFRAKKIVLACGRWIEKFVPSLSKVLRLKERTVYFLDLVNPEKYEVGKFPIFIRIFENALYYCLPNFDGHGVKIAQSSL